MQAREVEALRFAGGQFVSRRDGGGAGRRVALEGSAEAEACGRHRLLAREDLSCGGRAIQRNRSGFGGDPQATKPSGVFEGVADARGAAGLGEARLEGPSRHASDDALERRERGERPAPLHGARSRDLAALLVLEVDRSLGEN